MKLKYGSGDMIRKRNMRYSALTCFIVLPSTLRSYAPETNFDARPPDKVLHFNNQTFPSKNLVNIAYNTYTKFE